MRRIVKSIFDTINEPIEQRVIAGLAKISLALKSQAWQDASTRGITPTQGQILTLLSAHGNSPMRLSEIANGLAVTPATASDAVSALVEKGLVEKSKASDDARAIAIALTAQGRQKAESIASCSDFLLVAIEHLSTEEKKVFLQILLKTIRNLQERGQIPISKMCINCRFFQPNIHPDPDRPHHCAFVDAPFGNRDLRLDCPEQVAARPETAARNWQAFHQSCHQPS